MRERHVAMTVIQRVFGSQSVLSSAGVDLTLLWMILSSLKSATMKLAGKASGPRKLYGDYALYQYLWEDKVNEASRTYRHGIGRTRIWLLAFWRCYSAAPSPK